MNLEIFISDSLALLKLGGAVTGNSSLLASRFRIYVSIKGKPRTIVVISKYLKEGLSELEFNAIYYHELGHHIKNHSDNSICRLNNAQKELEADLYSAKLVTPEVLISALKKIPDVIRNCKELRRLGTLNKTDNEYSKNLNIFLDNINSKMEYRYEALRNLCKK